jgi:hypothetical protein
LPTILPSCGRKPVDDSIVVDRLKSLGDLEEFVRQVAAYVTGAQPEP